MTPQEPGAQDSAQATNQAQIHANPQEIYTIDSEKDEEITGDTEKSKALLSHSSNNPDTASRETTEYFSPAAQSNFLTLLRDYIPTPRPIEIHRGETSQYPRSSESETRETRKTCHGNKSHTSHTSMMVDKQSQGSRPNGAYLPTVQHIIAPQTRRSGACQNQTPINATHYMRAEGGFPCTHNPHNVEGTKMYAQCALVTTIPY